MAPQILKTSSLLSLPAELRNRIYDLVLLDNQTHANGYEIDVDSDYFSGDQYWVKGQISPLLHVCRQVRSETQAMYWAQVTLRGWPTDLCRAMPLLDEVAKAHIKTIAFDISDECEEDQRSFMRWCRRVLLRHGLRFHKAVLRATVRASWNSERADYEIEEPFFQ